MWFFLLAIVSVGTFSFSSTLASAEMAVVEVALSGDVQDRDPLGRLQPAVSCEKGQNAQASVPVFDSASGEKIFFWNKVKVTTPGILRHTWYRKGEEGWAHSAAVDLMLSESLGYRTWSSKRIVQSVHQGEWKVEVSTAEAPEQVLCTAQFRVE